MNERTFSYEARISLQDAHEGQTLFGPQDQFLLLIEQQTSAQLLTRGATIVIQGNEAEVQRIERLFDVLLTLIRRGMTLSSRDIAYALALSRTMQIETLLYLAQEDITTTVRGKAIRAKTLAQRHYVHTIRKCDLSFGIGPAGTGKTYLAVVCAVAALKEGSIKRIILTRPAVEAGESLGFLPGDLREKADPYLRPIYDALHDILGSDAVAKLLERGVIEVAPLAYMRGRTLDDSFVLLDEAQNTTSEQMKMCLTRLGHRSKMVVTGDKTQIDLPKGKMSGLIEAELVLQNIADIGFISFAHADIVRHTLVQKIVEAYAVHKASPLAQ